MRRLYISGMALLLGGACLFFSSCAKYKDEPGRPDTRLSRKYCNDPEAVNYDFDFPGTADNSVCYYPAEAFSGTYRFTDSIYNGANKLLLQDSIVLQVHVLSRNQFFISGFCAGGNDSLRFTATRTLRATGDSTVLSGQLLCRPKDTLSGYLTRSLGDSSRLRVFLTVVSDTGTVSHTGTAYQQ